MSQIKKKRARVKKIKTRLQKNHCTGRVVKTRTMLQTI
jgi:hypothetical protein